ncbi:MAG: FAD-binding oxidoreductase [Streptosporangiaceae bacterium]
MADLIARLREELPANAVIDDPDLTAGYQRDEASFCPAGIPAVVVRPETTAQVQHILRTASGLGVAVVAQGARTGISGAANAIDGCIILSLTRMNRVVRVDPANRVAVTQPGVTNAELSRAVAGRGLFYPPDPASWEMSTIGGNIATNAGGLCCVKYGVTSEYVLGLEVVLPSGEVLRTGRRTAKGVAGYDLTKLLVGSEGTLGVVTEAALRLLPTPPPSLTMAALFATTVAAGEAVAAITAGRHNPSLLEIMDRATLRAINDLRDMGLPEDAAAMLLAQSDAEDPAAAVAEMGKVCRDVGAVEVVEASDQAESDMLLQARRMVHPAVERLGTSMVDDVCVPRSRLAELIDGVAAIAGEEDVRVLVAGHAGDGNMHPIIVFDGDDQEETARAQRAFGRIMRLGLDLGGTITGEHGVGVLKRDWLAREAGPLGVRLQREIKAVFDPAGILNPGKVL